MKDNQQKNGDTINISNDEDIHNIAPCWLVALFVILFTVEATMYVIYVQ